MSDQNKEVQLYNCLKKFCEIAGIPFTGDSILDGIADSKNDIKPSMVPEICKRLNITSVIQKISTKDLLKSEISNAIIINKDESCYVYLGNKDHESVKIIDRDTDSISTLTIKKFEEDYSGYCLSLDYEETSDPRLLKSAGINLNSGKWFAKTIALISHTFSHIIIATAIINILSFALPVYILGVYDRVIPNMQYNTLYAFYIGILIIFVVDFFIKMMRSFIIGQASQAVSSRMSYKIFSHTLGLKFKNLDLGSTAFMKAFEEFTAVRTFMATATIVALIDLPFLALYLLGLYYFGGALLLSTVIIGIIVVLLISFYIQPATQASTKSAIVAERTSNSIMLESINNIETVKSLAAENYFLRKTLQIKASANVKQFHTYIVQSGPTVAAAVNSIVGATVVLLGCILIMKGQLTIGGMVACTILAGRALNVAQISGLLSKYHSMKNSLNSLNKYMELETDYSQGDNYLYKDKYDGNIEFKNVCFQYKGRSNKAVDNVSFSVKSGEKVGIIGHVGSGKSTLLKMIVDFIEPDSGQVLVDGNDSNTYNPQNIRRHIHYMSADISLFYGTLLDNIRIANQHASDELISKAIEISGINTMIGESHQGLNMVINENGSNLSLGQKQNIAIARAIVTDPDVLILDEPTAFIDNIQGTTVIKKIVQHMKGRTLIMISHRAPLFHDFDRVIQLSNGKIIQDGKTQDVLKSLMKQSAAFMAKLSNLE
jgi:ATP-binding cassette, subfamily C, bacterial LapB